MISDFDIDISLEDLMSLLSGDYSKLNSEKYNMLDLETNFPQESLPQDDLALKFPNITFVGTTPDAISIYLYADPNAKVERKIPKFIISGRRNMLVDIPTLLANKEMVEFYANEYNCIYSEAMVAALDILETDMPESMQLVKEMNSQLFD